MRQRGGPRRRWPSRSAANVDTILGTLRDEGGYDGRIVVVGYYPLGLHRRGDDLRQSSGLNEALATAAAERHDADVRRAPFEAVPAGRRRPRAAAASRPGLVYPDDVHPTPEGQRLLADAVEQVLGS